MVDFFGSNEKKEGDREGGRGEGKKEKREGISIAMSRTTEPPPPPNPHHHQQQQLLIDSNECREIAGERDVATF